MVAYRVDYGVMTSVLASSRGFETMQFVFNVSPIHLGMQH